MRVESTVVRLRLAETFVIAREARDWEDVVQVELRHGDHVGRREALTSQHHGHDPSLPHIAAAGHGDRSAVGEVPGLVEAADRPTIGHHDHA